MGVPKFYRWISERYPCLSEVVNDYQIPEFDNLYLDMNGIIHPCSHPNDDDAHFRISEEKIFQNIFHYLEVLFRSMKPKKVFFMAVDGVAPRAKMNQQRGRRFRSAKEAEELIKQALQKGEALPSEERFDSNCITPGTSFMVKLHEQLKYFVNMKITHDKMWQGLRIYLSGHETPGEGEHKIMQFIRHEKSQPGYDPNTRHCLYGLDADLIILGLVSHEPHFSLLREEVKFGGKSQKRFYPHNYAPYMSDITDFADFNVELDMGTPFLPYEQLLAVLPPASKKLVPAPLQKLMVDDNSPIIDFYPPEFKSDLNGKKQEWEAVVLIPFIEEVVRIQCPEDQVYHLLHLSLMRDYLEYEFAELKGALSFPFDLEQVINDWVLMGFLVGNDFIPHLPHMHIHDNALPILWKTYINVMPRLDGEISIAKGVKVGISVGPKDMDQEDLDSDMQRQWKQQVNALSTRCHDRWGVKIGDTHLLLDVRPISGKKYVCEDDGRVTLEKQWVEKPIPMVYQLCAKDLIVEGPTYKQFKTIDEFYSVGSDCFMLGQPHYGCMGQVLEIDPKYKGRIRIKVEVLPDLNLTPVKGRENELRIKWMPGYVAAKHLCVSSSIVSRITGSLYLIKGPRGHPDPQNAKIGLNLKLNKTNKEVPGYTKKMDDNWYYSPKVLEDVERYMEKFPELFESLANYSHDVYEEDIYPNSNGEKGKEIVRFITTLGCSKLPPEEIGTKYLAEPLVRAIEDEAKKLREARTPGKTVKMQVRSHLIYRPIDNPGSLQADTTTTYALWDRVVNARDGYSVPLGLRGTVVGILPGATSAYVLYEVVFDEAFPNAITIRGSSDCGYRLPAFALINLSHGERKLRGEQTPEAGRGRNEPRAAQQRFNHSPNSPFVPQQKIHQPGSYPQNTQPQFVTPRGPKKYSPLPQPTHQAVQTSGGYTHRQKNLPPRLQPKPQATDEFSQMWQQLQLAPSNGNVAPQTLPPSVNTAVPMSKENVPSVRQSAVDQQRQAWQGIGPSLQQAAKALGKSNITAERSRAAHENEPLAPPQQQQQPQDQKPLQPQEKQQPWQQQTQQQQPAKQQPWQQQQQKQLTQSKKEDVEDSTKALKQLLNIKCEGDVPSEGATNSNVDAVQYGIPVSVEDLFKTASEAALIRQQQQQQPRVQQRPIMHPQVQAPIQPMLQKTQMAAHVQPNRVSAQGNQAAISALGGRQQPRRAVYDLAMWCQGVGLHPPHYEYISQGSDVFAKLTLSNGLRCQGSMMRSRDQAAESAAAVTLMHVGSNNPAMVRPPPLTAGFSPRPPPPPGGYPGPRGLHQIQNSSVHAANMHPINYSSNVLAPARFVPPVMPHAGIMMNVGGTFPRSPQASGGMEQRDLTGQALAQRPVDFNKSEASSDSPRTPQKSSGGIPAAFIPLQVQKQQTPVRKKSAEVIVGEQPMASTTTRRSAGTKVAEASSAGSTQERLQTTNLFQPEQKPKDAQPKQKPKPRQPRKSRLAIKFSTTGEQI
ncbi:PREDICTED: 5'-3' exoribonuclease 1-like [Priapulus caudatus]|uniref:5'-3' exoribonuclease 1-like n=1 Tax=Priapulus caudatus TaxID=37621 RepID=A0ABM1DPA6_PRICU|nr:PREDICTED: 5'-3' exoribonuclease 1-like [Priapulus caudatus]